MFVDNDSEAARLRSEVKILCWIMTAPKNLMSKARHVKAAWGKRCNKLVFFSSKNDSILPAIGLNIREGRDFLWGKTKRAFKYVFDNHFHQADWFLKADDDTYVIVENLRYMLSHFNASQPIYFGRHFRPYVAQGYMSGGAGYVLSKQALYRFVTQALAAGGRHCRRSDGGAEDLEMGQCLMSVGVKPVDSRDQEGRERFHPFIPEHHAVPNVLPSNMWIFQYNFYPTKQVSIIQYHDIVPVNWVNSFKAFTVVTHLTHF